MSDRQFDIAILGATGYSGTITAEYIAGKRKNERVAIAGRAKDKLDELKAELVVCSYCSKSCCYLTSS